ncbi:hypothetical protein A0H81_12332 [Grifola frondosa]|uniref:Uncharacterized protein n=1 Tax=Grifola frondosa TaxID=5627 RepID=A0A1C7LXQ4_GRIFR|nr:hypothetical protein A0H81_12332 [Grifola frondosa]
MVELVDLCSQWSIRAKGRRFFPLRTGICIPARGPLLLRSNGSRAARLCAVREIFPEDIDVFLGTLTFGDTPSRQHCLFNLGASNCPDSLRYKGLV